MVGNNTCFLHRLALEMEQRATVCEDELVSRHVQCFVSLLQTFDILIFNHISLQELSIYSEDVVTAEEAEFNHVRVNDWMVASWMRSEHFSNSVVYVPLRHLQILWMSGLSLMRRCSTSFKRTYLLSCAWKNIHYARSIFSCLFTIYIFFFIYSYISVVPSWAHMLWVCKTGFSHLLKVTLF